VVRLFMAVEEVILKIKLIIPWLENSYGVLVDDLQTSKVTNREDI